MTDITDEMKVAAVEALASRPIGTDDQVEALARECDWDNRKYMTPKDYAIWCERMRKFARLASQTHDNRAYTEQLRQALEPLARLEIPAKPHGNAGAYSIRHSDIQAARAALASPSIVAPVGVGELEWVDYHDRDRSAPRWKAKHAFGEYIIILDTRDMEYWRTDLGISKTWSSLEAAKASAQNDYGYRIMSALIPADELAESQAASHALSTTKTEADGEWATMRDHIGRAWSAVGHHEGIEISVQQDAADTWNALCALLDPMARISVETKR